MLPGYPAGVAATSPPYPTLGGQPPRSTQCVQGLRNCRKLLRHKSNRNVVESQYRELKNLYTLYYLHRLNAVVNLGILGKISSYPTYPITVILKMAMHLEDPELTAQAYPANCSVSIR